MATQAGRTDPGTAPSGAPIPITKPSGPRAAAEHVVSSNTMTVLVGDRRLELSPMDQFVFLAGLGFIAACELIEWPIPLAIGVGHELARSRHGKVLREFEEAMEAA